MGLLKKKPAIDKASKGQDATSPVTTPAAPKPKSKGGRFGRKSSPPVSAPAAAVASSSHPPEEDDADEESSSDEESSDEEPQRQQPAAPTPPTKHAAAKPTAIPAQSAEKRDGSDDEEESSSDDDESSSEETETRKPTAAKVSSTPLAAKLPAPKASPALAAPVIARPKPAAKPLESAKEAVPPVVASTPASTAALVAAPPPLESAPSRAVSSKVASAALDDDDDDAALWAKVAAAQSSRFTSSTKKESDGPPLFEGAGEALGLLVWRIEKFHPAPVEKAMHGKFHSGDSYIILHTKVTKSGGFEFDLFFWLGSNTSVDEQGAAAILSRDLDDKLGGRPVQHRIVQGHEPALFSQAMGGTLEYLDGGVDGAFQSAKTGPPVRLLHVKGVQQCRVVQVELNVRSLNSGDVFILDTGATVYLWSGKESSTRERLKGAEVCRGMKEERVHQVEEIGEVEIVRMEQGEPSEDLAAFWTTLSGEKIMVAATVPDSADDDKQASAQVQLFQLSDEGGRLKSKEITDRPLLRQHLDANDVFILACPAEIFAWIGSKASQQERSMAMAKAQKFLTKSGMPSWAPCMRVVQGTEPVVFTSKFEHWNELSGVGVPDVENIMLGKGISSGSGRIALNVREYSVRELLEGIAGADGKHQPGMVVDKAELTRRVEQRERDKPELVPRGRGQLRIWRIVNFRKVEVDDAMHGVFHAGDSYIVLFTYEVNNKPVVIIYYWLGRLSTSDEKGSAALLVRTMDDEEYGGNARQVRVWQNNEPEDFIALFGGDMVVRDGGTGKSGADTRDHDGVSLFHVKGQSAQTVRAVQVEEVATSLNSTDCFVLERPGAIDVWHGSRSSSEERSTSELVGHAIAKRLAYAAEHAEPALNAQEAAADAAAVAAAQVDEDGDGVPDVAVPFVLSGTTPANERADKLGTFLPQQETQNGRPFYAHESNPGLLVWWSGGRWWLGKSDEMGRNRGWFKVKSLDVSPPQRGWLVYVSKEKTWKECVDMSCDAAERIVFCGETPAGAQVEKLGEWCRTADVCNDRFVYCKETRPKVLMWWSSGRWWIGKRDERGTNKGWLRVISDAMSPLEIRSGWMVYLPDARKWAESTTLHCEFNTEELPTVDLPASLATPATSSGPLAPCTTWTVAVCTEGQEPAEFWTAIRGKAPYSSEKPTAATEGFEPRLFECSDSTGAFRVEEIFDFSQEDLDHDDVYILDCWRATYVWVGANNVNEREMTQALEIAKAFIRAQGEHDGRPVDIDPQLVSAGAEPREFTAEFVGWSKANASDFEDPYEKRVRLAREQLLREEQESLDTADDESAASTADSNSTKQASDLLRSSVPIANVLKKWKERNGCKPPPVTALRNDLVLLRENAVPIPGATKVPKLDISLLGKSEIHEASTLDSARRRASAAAKAAGSDSAEYADPTTERFDIDEIKGGTTARPINPMCKELYVHDEQFRRVFGMDKDTFWKQPFWKQRDAKRNAGVC